jgi:glycosyltransferase involved in cell wall biosynthesis
MPVYNSRPDYFRLSLDALLGQTLGDFELILSDNGSGDEARALYEEAAGADRRIRYVRHDKNRGAVFNFNFALEQASAPYFMWAADDDLYDRSYLARTVPVLDRSPAVVTASSEMRFIDKDGGRIGAASFSPLAASPFAARRVGALMAKHVYMDIYALHRRTALERTRRHRAMMGGDYALVLEMLLQGPIERVPEELFAHRMHHDASHEHVSWQLVGDGAPMLARKGLLRRLARELGEGVMRSNLSLLGRILSLSAVGTVILRRRRSW